MRSPLTECRQARRARAGAAGAATRLFGRALGDRAGVASVEFAVVCAAFLLFLVGIMEGGRAIWTSTSLQFAAEQAGRYVIANPLAADGDIRSYARQQLAMVNPDEVTVTIDRQTAGGVAFVTVTTSYAFAPVTGLPVIGALTLTGRSRIPLTG